MIIDLNRYRRNIKPLVQYYVERNPDINKSDALTVVAGMTDCHIVAVGYYMAELFGMTEELRNSLDRLEKFYNYPIVVNKQE